jgi:hypothetical protein
MAEDNDFSLKMKTDLRVVYGNDPTLRGGNLDTHYQLLKDMKPDHPKYEPLKQELIKSAMNEISDLVKEYKLYLDEYVQTTRAARVASMLPTEGQWPAIVRQQNALERLLERKIRLLMELQEHRIVCVAPPPGFDPTPPPIEDEGPNSDEPINSGNELDDLLQSQGLTQNDPLKRTGPLQQNEPQGDANQTEEPALSPGERVGRDGAFTSRRGSGEGSLHCCTHPPQHTENSGNELNDLLQSQDLTPNDPSKRTGPSALDEPPRGASTGVHVLWNWRGARHGVR